VKRQDNVERLLLKNARWDKVRKAEEQQKEEGFPADDVDEMASRLTRWWNEDLTALRNDGAI
jgi:hypothetical protein